MGVTEMPKVSRRNLKFKPMKKLLLLFIAALISVQVMAQRVPSEKKTTISAGVLMGGGGIVGANFEYMPAKHFSFDVEAGLVSFGAGLNYHFKPYINSSMLSVVYWHQGVGDSYVQSVVGPVFTYRAPKVFQFQAGFGFKAGEGPNAIEDGPDFMLLYSIGVYFPL